MFPPERERGEGKRCRARKRRERRVDVDRGNRTERRENKVQYERKFRVLFVLLSADVVTVFLQVSTARRCLSGPASGLLPVP